MEALTQHIVELMVDKLEVPAASLGLDVDFESMGLDSLVLVQLAVLLSRRYGISLDDAELLDAKTIENTATLLQAKGARV